MLTYKRKLILNKAQQQRIDSWMGVCRMVYNMGLEIRISAWRNKQKSVHRFELSRQVTEIRDIPWIQDVPIQCLQDSIKRLDYAYKKFFSTCHKGGGFPRFKSKRDKQSISFKYVSAKGDHVKLCKIGNLKMVKDKRIIGIPKVATVFKDITGYYVCITCADVTKNIQNKDENQVIGLDMGVTHFCVDSNGNFTENPRHFKKYERQLRIENRSLARKRKGSANWKKQVRKLSVVHNKIGNVRKDFLHKLSTNYAKACHTVFIEDLNINGMVKNERLSMHILDAGWGEFRRMLEYKTNIVAIDPKHTSQTCNDCGAKDAKSRVSQSKFVCTSCGAESNADENAAKNILSRGTAHVRERKAIA